MNPSEAISASFRPSYRPYRQVRSPKPPIGFGLMPFLPPIGVNAPSLRPEITTYGKPPVQFFRSGQAGGPVRKAVLRPSEGSNGSTRGSLPRQYTGWERGSEMNPSEAISASFRPSYRPDRQVRSPKPHIGFGIMSFSPRIRVNAPSPRPEITTYGKPLLRFFRSGRAGGEPVLKGTFRLPGAMHECTDDKNSGTLQGGQYP
jgi:hypothetical protein